MHNFKALFRDKLAKFGDVIWMNTFLLMVVGSILNVVVKKTRAADNSTTIGAEAF